MSWLRRLLRRRTGGDPLGFFGHDLSVAFLGHLFSKGLGFLTYLVIARRLHPAELALVGLADAVMQIAFQVSELGLETGVARFVAKGIRKDDGAAIDRVLRAVFLLKLALGTALFVLAFAATPLIAVAILKQPDTLPYLRVGLIGIYGMHLSGFYQAYFTARLEFAKNALFVSLSPLLIFVAVSIAWLVGRVSAMTLVWIYAIVPVVVWSAAALALPHGFLREKGGVADAARGVWRFSRWIYLTGTLGEIRFRLNSILLARLRSEREVGLYFFADKLAATLTLFTGTILTVFIPRASHLVSQAEIRVLLRKSYRWLALLLPPLAVVPFLVVPLLRLVAPRYAEASPYFVLLFISVLFSLAATPARTVIYSLHRPEVEAAVEALALAITLGVGYWLVATRGLLGAALTMLIQRAISSALVIGWVHVKVYRAPREEVETALLTSV